MSRNRRSARMWGDSTSPTAAENSGTGSYGTGDLWLDTAGDDLYVLVDAGAGTWTQLTGGGGGGGGDHATLTHLSWTTSGHTGTASRIAAFDGSGAASYLVVGTDVQAYDAGLASFTGVDTVADRYGYTTAANTWAAGTITAFARTLLDDVDAAAGRGTLAAAPVAGPYVTTSASAELTGETVLTAGALMTLGGAATVGVTFAATQRVAGRNTAGAGAGEEVTATQVLDWLGSTQGQVLYRGAASWAALAAGTLGYLFTAGGAAADPSWVSPIETVLAAWIDPSFGDSSDGNVTLGSNITLVRDMEYGTLDLAGFSIDCDGYRLRCRRLKNTGGACTISNNGDSAVNRVAGAGPQAHSLGNGVAGGNGGTSGAAGTNGVARSASWGATITGGNTSDGGAGGASGAGQAGGAKGDATAINWTSGTPSKGGTYFTDMTWSTTAVNAVNGGAGGGGGGASAAGGSAGGGGGGGGGVCTVHAHTIESSASNITIQANAGNAGNVAGTNAGGGGGGGGGYAKLVYQVALGSLPTVEAKKGTGTAAVGTGVAGSDGNDGITEIRRLGT